MTENLTSLPTATARNQEGLISAAYQVLTGRDNGPARASFHPRPM